DEEAVFAADHSDTGVRVFRQVVDHAGAGAGAAGGDQQAGAVHRGWAGGDRVDHAGGAAGEEPALAAVEAGSGDRSIAAGGVGDFHGGVFLAAAEVLATAGCVRGCGPALDHPDGGGTDGSEYAAADAGTGRQCRPGGGCGVLDDGVVDGDDHGMVAGLGGVTAIGWALVDGVGSPSRDRSANKNRSGLSARTGQSCQK